MTEDTRLNAGFRSRDDLPKKENGKKWNANTLYTPEFCDDVLRIMSQGKCMETCASEMGIRFSTFKNWRKNYPEFDAAVIDGVSLAKDWWEEQAREHLVIMNQKDGPSTTFNTRVYLHAKAVRFNESERATNVNINVGDGTNVDETIKKVQDTLEKLHTESI